MHTTVMQHVLKTFHGLWLPHKQLYKRCAKSMKWPKIRPPTTPTFINRS